jgi:hypothetical protein
MNLDKAQLNAAMDKFFNNIQLFNMTVYSNRASFARRAGIMDDTKFLLDLFELIANSRFYDAYQKIQFMREYLFGAVPREILQYLHYVGRNENGLK